MIIVIYPHRISIVAITLDEVMGGIRDHLSKRYAARPGERWSPPQGEKGGSRSIFPWQSRQTARSRTARPDFMFERLQRIILDATNLDPRD